MVDVPELVLVVVPVVVAVVVAVEVPVEVPVVVIVVISQPSKLPSTYDPTASLMTATVASQASLELSRIALPSVQVKLPFSPPRVYS